MESWILHASPSLRRPPPQAQQEKLAASRLLFNACLFLTVNFNPRVFTFPNNNHHPTSKKKNRKSNPNHSPCPSTFTHVHVQETAGWELSAANYVFDSCSRAETTQRASGSNTKQARQRSHCVQSWRLSKSRASMLPPDWTGF